MKLEFKISKIALIRDAFFWNEKMREKEKKEPFAFWSKIEKQLWEKYKDDPFYYLINPIHSNWGLNELFIQSEEKGIEKILSDTAKGIEKISQEIIKSKEFKKIFSETIDYKNFVEEQWEKNNEVVWKYFKEVLNINIPKDKISVYIFHNKTYHGNANPNTKTILWAHSEDWKNYTTVYLAHEILHLLADKKCEDQEIMHALIELATDNELRIRLNKKGQYFKETKYNIGHKYLRPLEKKILPYWKKFLTEKNKNIFQLEKEIIKKGCI